MKQHQQGHRQSARLLEKARIADTKINPPSTAKPRNRRVAGASSKKRAKATTTPVKRRGRPRKTQEPGSAVIEVPPKSGKEGPVYHWIEHQNWPEELFEPLGEDIELSQMESQSPTGRAYASPRCPTFLQSKGVYLQHNRNRLAAQDKEFLRRALGRDCVTPIGTAFDENSQGYLSGGLTEKNETAVIRMISQLIVPSAELEICRGGLGYEGLIESINEPWIASICLGIDDPKTLQPLGAPRVDSLPTPQPDYALGVSSSFFTVERIAKLQSIIGAHDQASVFKGTPEMIFPFLTAEVKSSKESIVVAGRQSTYSMARALRGVVELFKRVGRQDELHQRSLGFSIVHDHERVAIFAHYPEFQAGKAKYYRDKVKSFDLDSGNWEDRWRPYKFVMALYHDWVPSHLERLCSAVDDLPAPSNQ